MKFSISSFLTVLCLFSQLSHAGNIDLSRLIYNDQNYEIIVACRVDNAVVGLLKRKKSDYHSMFELNNTHLTPLSNSVVIPYNRKMKNNRRSYSIKGKDGGFIQFEKVDLSIEKTSSEGKFDFKKQYLGDVMERKVRTISLELTDCTFANEH